MTGHSVALVVSDERPQAVTPDAGRWFRAECTCGWSSAWGRTNAVMGRGRRHVTMISRPRA